MMLCTRSRLAVQLEFWYEYVEVFGKVATNEMGETSWSKH